MKAPGSLLSRFRGDVIDVSSQGPGATLPQPGGCETSRLLASAGARATRAGLDLGQISRAYGFPVIDYERPGTGICIASGSGMMMAVMDSLPCLRWSIEIDPPRRLDRWRDWLSWVDRLAEPVVVAGTFSEASYQCPESFVAGFGAVTGEKLHYYIVGTHLDLGIGMRADSLGGLFAAVLGERGEQADGGSV